MAKFVDKLKNIFKRKPKETKEQKHVRYLEEKKRAFIHKKMEEKDAESRKKEKIPPSEDYIILKDVNKIYSNHVQAVYDFNLMIKEHEFIAFVGPSGCGKSTTLKMVAGLEDITCGDLFIDKVYSNDLEPKKRGISMVFQSYALYPNMTVYENLAFALKVQHLSNDEIKEKVMRVAKILDIEEYLKRKPSALSGGQRQRVALGRAIIKEAKVCLMDEPLSNLDAKLRVQMRSEIVRLHRETKATTIYVTHDQVEAMTMADRVVVMNRGVVQQIGTPQEVYKKPTNKFVATFIGSPRMNMIPTYYDDGILTLDNGYSFKISEKQRRLFEDFYNNEIDRYENEINKINSEVIDGNDDEKIIELNTMLVNEINKKIDIVKDILCSKKTKLSLGVRSSDIYVNDAYKKVTNCTEPFDSVVLFAELLGSEYYVHTKLGDLDITSSMVAEEEIVQDSPIKLSFDLDEIHLFDDISNKSIF